MKSMKKTLTMLLMICVIITTVFMIFACKEETGGESEITTESEKTTDAGNVPDNTTAPDVEQTTEPEYDPYEYNPRLECAWRKDDTTIVFQFDGFVSAVVNNTDILENIYVASSESGDPIAKPVSFLTYNGDLSKTYEVTFSETLPEAGTFYLVLKETSGDGDQDLANLFVDYSSTGVYGNTKKGSDYVATVAVTDEEIIATKSLFIEWCKLVGENVVAVKYSEPVATDYTKVNEYGHVPHIAPLLNGQLTTNASQEQLDAFPGSQADIIQRHTRYFMTYEKDPTIVLYIFSTDYYGTGSDFIEDSFALDAQAWVEGAEALGEEYTMVIREYPYECISAVDTGKQCATSRDIVIEGVDFDAVDLTGIVGAKPGRR